VIVARQSPFFVFGIKNTEGVSLFSKRVYICIKIKVLMNNTTFKRLQEHLIERVKSTTDVDKLVRFLIFLDELPISEESAKRIFRPISKGISLETLKQEQNFTGTDWDKADKWARELDIQEPIEELLSQLSN
jgi:hypothetical protein